MSLFRPQMRDEVADPDAKRSLNREMFDDIARKYHITTRALSFCRDASWKRALAANLRPASPPALCLDLATGTGDIAALVAERFPGAKIVGLDLSAEMIALSRLRLPDGDRFEFVEGDIGAMPFSDDYADVITGGYALRNVPDLDVALAEIFRVLKPGGIASFLDFMKPVAPWRQRMDQALLHFWGGVVGLAMHGRPWIYQYIPESLAAYPDERTVREKLRAAGFDVTGGRRHFFGMLETIELRKPA